MEFVKNRIIKPIQRVVSAGITPAKLATSIAAGIVGGLFPVPFTTTLVCVPLIFLLGANAVIVQTINLLLTPLQLFCIPFFLTVGQLMAPGLFDVGDLSISAVLDSIQESGFNGVVAGISLFMYAIIGWLGLSAPMLFGLSFALRPLMTRILGRPHTN